MNKQNTIGNIKGLTFVGGQITSRVDWKNSGDSA